jgi:two-component sensor histidine kinase
MSETDEQTASIMLELAVRLRQQEIVAAFGVAALRERNLDVVMQAACEAACKGLDTRLAKVLRYREASSDFLLTHGVGWHDGVVGVAVVGADIASPAGYAVRTKLPVVSNHLAQESRFRTPAVLAEHNIQRAINVIIEEDDGKPFGVLEADSTSRQAFTRHDIAFMQALANVLAAAIEHGRQVAAQEVLMREKDILLQEVHHRTKNSLQLVQTLLHLQARGLANGDEKNRLEEAAARIRTIAAVHQRLHQNGSVQLVDAGEYLTSLLADIAASLAPEGQSRVTVEAEPMQLAVEQVTPLGLIASELVTNALKYGGGAISLRVIRTAAGVDIVAEDGGAGFPPGYVPGASRSLGMRLVVALARTPDPVSIDRVADKTQVTVRVTLPTAAG